MIEILEGIEAMNESLWLVFVALLSLAAFR
jgi:hypothetical protein